MTPSFPQYTNVFLPAKVRAISSGKAHPGLREAKRSGCRNHLWTCGAQCLPGSGPVGRESLPAHGARAERAGVVRHSRRSTGGVAGKPDSSVTSSFSDVSSGAEKRTPGLCPLQQLPDETVE